MAGAADELQRVFKTLSDPTRMRIIHLLECEELVVQELMEILGMAQSRVSRHLAILREVGLLSDRRDGTYVSYRFTPPPSGPWHEGWNLVKASLDGDAIFERDAAMLRQVIESRAGSARKFFDAVGPEWDALRKVFNDDTLRARAINRLVKKPLRVLDVGTGTGILATELASLGLDVIGLDSSPRMLAAARASIDGATHEQWGEIELRLGEADRMPLADAEVDAAFAHMVLHYVPSPADVVAEMARVVRPGGTLVIVDFVLHTHDWMRQELGVVWMGFELSEVRRWFAMAGLPEVQITQSEATTSGRDLPATFIASARREASASLGIE